MTPRPQDSPIARRPGAGLDVAAPGRGPIDSRRDPRPDARLSRRAAPARPDLAPSERGRQPGLFAALDLAGRPVIVIGGGTSSQERLGPLLMAGADVTVIAPALSPAIESLVASGRIGWHLRKYRPGDLAGAWLAMVGTHAPDVETLVVAEARRARIFCVGLDDSGRGSLLPASTGSAEGSMVAVLGPDSERGSAGVAAIRRGLRSRTIPVPVRNERIRPGVVLVGGGPGNPDLLTVRGRELLRRADTVVVNGSTPWQVLDELGSHVEIIDVPQERHARPVTRPRPQETVIAGVRAGKVVVRITDGDPFVDGPGYEELTACCEAGVPVTVIPGVSDAAAAISYARFPASMVTSQAGVSVVSAHLPPGHPDSLVNWAAVAGTRGTVVLLGALPHIGQIAAALLENGRPAGTRVVVIQEAATRGKRILHATLDDVADRIERHEIARRSTVILDASAWPTTPEATIPDLACESPGGRS